MRKVSLPAGLAMLAAAAILGGIVGYVRGVVVGEEDRLDAAP